MARRRYGEVKRVEMYEDAFEYPSTVTLSRGRPRHVLLYRDDIVGLKTVASPRIKNQAYPRQLPASWRAHCPHTDRADRHRYRFTSTYRPLTTPVAALAPQTTLKRIKPQSSKRRRSGWAKNKTTAFSWGYRPRGGRPADVGGGRPPAAAARAAARPAKNGNHYGPL
ncbi:hypothetical protein EVAR_35925_1 [Eumeta japonica]|uniref:Uncharacterized protein n=1 Tax=Eumeta variegata TaxID=151549 RepID=A0A4C1W2Y2_EUMVA|nr:hypothetical protein EVAR_35925_1 [Eumeta japonica]